MIQSRDLPHRSSEEKGSLETACQNPDDSIMGEGKVAVGIYADGTIVVAFSDGTRDHDEALRQAASDLGITGSWEFAGGAYFTIRSNGHGFYGKSRTLDAGIPEQALPEVMQEFERLIQSYMS